MTAAKRATTKASAAAKLEASTSVDLGKLRKASLKRYKKHFKLECKAESKNDLVEVVMRHFATMPIKEEAVAIDFHNFARTLRGRRAPDSLTPNPNGNQQHGDALGAR